MSDSWISWNPRTLDPSNGWPSVSFCLGQFVHRHREVLDLTRQVGEPKIDDLGLVLLRHRDDVFRRCHARFPLFARRSFQPTSARVPAAVTRPLTLRYGTSMCAQSCTSPAQFHAEPS